TSEQAQNVVIGQFPLRTSTISQETVDAAGEFLARDELPTALRRLVAEGRADVIRAMRAREVDRAARN
ncbi:MAG: aminopeptidase, partial [Pseudonocardiales bacterium]|nr:aminopeptidase [Pseudonocardiales bacterium]